LDIGIISAETTAEARELEKERSIATAGRLVENTGLSMWILMYHSRTHATPDHQALKFVMVPEAAVDNNNQPPATSQTGHGRKRRA
jgi:hypothetical protein